MHVRGLPTARLLPERVVAVSPPGSTESAFRRTPGAVAHRDALGASRLLSFVRLSSERARQEVRRDCSFAKKRESPPALLVVVRSESPRGAAWDGRLRREGGGNSMTVRAAIGPSPRCLDATASSLDADVDHEGGGRWRRSWPATTPPPPGSPAQLTSSSVGSGCWTGLAAGVPSRLNCVRMTFRSWLLTPVNVPPVVPATRAPLVYR
jgi:hypothetical protein